MAAGIFSGRKPKAPVVKPLSLALQGGGSHGAFTWGVLDRLLEDGRLKFSALTATSAGAMNAVAYANGLQRGGPDGARERLESFWSRVSRKGAPFNVFRNNPFANTMFSPLAFMNMLSQVASPYDLNPLDFNPLRESLLETVDFEQLNRCKTTSLFIAATNVRTGRVRVFRTYEVTADVVLASACLPQLFKAVEIAGEPYWDGGYVGNPALFPLFYTDSPRDILIVHVNPLQRDGVPKAAHEIIDRMNEITFNASLLSELRAIGFVQRLLDENWLADRVRSRYRKLYLHAILADEPLAGLSVESKFDTSWRFLTDLRDRGRAAASVWLEANMAAVGKRASVDLRQVYLSLGEDA
jgi:NTE family protein